MEMAMGRLTQYDVFLNHRGRDLKKTFVSHMDAALRQAGREPFLDAKSLMKGQHAFNSINEALTGCLCMLQYSPEEVGPFAEAFCEHTKKGRDEDVVRRKAALMKVVTIIRFRLVDCNNDTMKLEEKIVVVVLDALPTFPPLEPARHPVGLKESFAHVITMLHKMGDNVGVMGICGVGGIGKTTLAKEIYNQEQSNFSSWCLLKDVKEAKGVSVMDLQMRMIMDLLHVDAKKMHWDFARWFEEIQKQRVLLVIDDISERKQFDELIPGLRELALGSRVIITSCERNILKSIKVDVPQSALYEVPELSFTDSLGLFVWCAFRKNNMDAMDVSFQNFAKEITGACCGLPLALEVMEGFLADKKNLPDDKKYWKEATLALRRDGDIITSLQMSYDDLITMKISVCFWT